MEETNIVDRSLKGLKTAFSVICLFSLLSIGATRAADNSEHDKITNLSKAESISNIENSQEKISVSEENRNHKTFQVATIIINASPEVVFDTFSDYKRAPEMFSNCKQARVLSSTGPNKQISFQAVLLGGLFTFDYVLEFKEYRPKLIEWHRVSGAFKANEGYWKFQATADGNSTLVTYSKYVDAGFPFPQFIVNKELRNDMPVILTELKTAVEKVN